MFAYTYVSSGKVGLCHFWFKGKLYFYYNYYNNYIIIIIFRLYSKYQPVLCQTQGHENEHASHRWVDNISKGHICRKFYFREQKVFNIDYGKVNNHAKKSSGDFNCHLNNEDKRMVKKQSKTPISSSGNQNRSCGKTSYSELWAESKPRTLTHHKLTRMRSPRIC